MSETVLINAATVAAGDPTAVVAHAMLVPGIQFRVVCDKAYTARFWVADVDFTDTDDAAELAGTADANHAATTGLVYSVDPGAYDYVACVVTNEDGADAATVTIAAGYDLVAEAPSALFTVAEARAFDKAQLASDTDYPDADVIAKEAEIREWLTRVCGVDFIPTVHTDEVVDGYGCSEVMLDWPRLTTLTAVSYRSYGTATWTALTAGQLATCQTTPEGLLIWEGGYFPKGRRMVKVTYTAGFATVPALIHRAALMLAVNEMPAQNAPWQADGFDAGGTTYSWSRGDGYRGNWSGIPDVQRAIVMYGHKPPAIA